MNGVFEVVTPAIGNDFLGRDVDVTHGPCRKAQLWVQGGQQRLITDLNISLQEREKAKRDYINSIQSYWVAYYQLRILTLYDFEKNGNITYGNPML